VAHAGPALLAPAPDPDPDPAPDPDAAPDSAPDEEPPSGGTAVAAALAAADPAAPEAGVDPPPDAEVVPAVQALTARTAALRAAEVHLRELDMPITPPAGAAPCHIAGPGPPHGKLRCPLDARRRP
jgi:hypothetical protein